LAGATTTTGGAENFPIIAFDDAADEFWDFLCALEGYAGGGLTVERPWASAAATTGDAVWGVAIRRLNSAEDLNTTDHTYAFNPDTDTTNGTAGALSYDTTTFTDGADMDSLAEGERFIMRVRRDADNGSDTLSGDALLLWPAIVIRET
jgi:hypothetical protein